MLKTSPELLALIERARHRKMTAQEKFEQRVSFVFSGLSRNSGVTRDQVRQMLATGRMEQQHV